MEVTTLGAGCFWCVEAIFQKLKGVVKVESGYMGGEVKNPSYKEVCTGRTGHAEVAQITFDPKIISFKDILEVFWQTHDPSTLNQQGADKGTQYRSAIFCHSQGQKQIAEGIKEKLNETLAFSSPVVTEITIASTFYVADNYHQDYYSQNGEEGYCRMVIKPKLDKFHKAFQDKLK